MPSFLQKFRDFFLLAPEETDDPYADAKPAALPPVEILKLEPSEQTVPKKPAEEKVPVKPAAEQASVTAAPAEPVFAPVAEAKPEPAAKAVPEAKPVAGEVSAVTETPAVAEVPVVSEAPAPEAAPAEPPVLPKRKRQPKKVAAEMKPDAEAVKAEETPAPVATITPEPAPIATAPAEDKPAAESPAAETEEADSKRSIGDKLRAFFFPGDEDADTELTLHNSREGRRPMGTKVRMASHRFTTVTSAPETSGTDCKPLDDESRALLELAKAVRQNAYAKYSGFKVGAALKATSGQVYFGVNVENASYPAGLCAERAAFAAAITAGERNFQAIAICGGDDSESCFPCGICRQVLMEMCPPSMPVILEKGVYRLDSLLPHSFKL